MTERGPGDGVKHATRATDPADLADDEDGWPVVDSETVWENPYFAAGYDEVEQPDGDTSAYYWIDPSDVVVVVAAADGQVVLVEQYDGRLRGSLLTCPGGSLDDGESFVDAGVRELREETGFRAGEADLLTTYHPTAWARMEQAVVYATDLEPGPTDRDAGEYLDVYTAPVDVALSAVRERSPAFGPGVTALMTARERGLV